MRFTIILLFVAVINLSAQDISNCPKTIIGELENGLTYYIKKNKEPKERADFYILQNVGAILETDKQNGLAHFLEHMAFNGTLNFPGNSLISELQKHGIAFGTNLNAYTSLDETVYSITDVSTVNEGLIDTCLLVLSEWSHNISLNTDDINEERGVILEEWRSRNNANSRISNQINSVIFQGSNYAKRDVIGDPKIIENFPPKRLRKFYEDWHRPDLQAIAVVGDFDPQLMEEKIIELFSQIPKPRKPKEREDFYIPNHKETYYVSVNDPAATNTLIQSFTILPKPFIRKDSEEYVKNGIITPIFNSLVEKRIQEIMNQAQPPFLSANIFHSNLTRNHNYLSYYAVPNGENTEEEENALRAILVLKEQIVRYGFSESELERVKKEVIASLESSIKEIDKISNSSYMVDIQNHFFAGTIIPSYPDQYELIIRLTSELTPKDISEAFRSWNIDENTSVAISGISDKIHLSESELEEIIQSVKESDITAYIEESHEVELISDDIVGSEIVDEIEKKELELTEFTLANGLKIIYKKADYDKDQLEVFAYSKGGTSLYERDLLENATNAAFFSSLYGLGELDALGLEKYLTGKIVSVQPTINERSEIISGVSSIKDAETLFQLVHLNFTQPRMDENAFYRLVSQNKIMYEQNQNDPMTQVQDSILKISTDYNQRSLILSKPYLDALDMNKMYNIYKERFSNAGDFIFIVVGNIEKDDVKPLISKYIGSLPIEVGKENWIERNVKHPSGHTKRRIEIDFGDPRAIIFNQFSKEHPYSIKDIFLNDILANILTIRYNNSIREEEGGTYGVSMSSSVPSADDIVPIYSLTGYFECEQERAEYLQTLIQKEINSIISDGVSQEELDKVTNAMLNEHEQMKRNNSYWLGVILNQYIYGINSNDPKNYEDIISGSTPTDVREFTRKLYSNPDIIDIIFSNK